MPSKDKSAFTLIELLVVIAIIGILSAVVLTSLNSSRTKSRAAAAVQTFQQIEKAIQQEFASDVQYPRETSFGLGSGPKINNLIIDGFLPSLEEQAGIIAGKEVLYDNDGNNRSECGSAFDGVSIYIQRSGINEVAPEIENLLDGEDGNCGKIQTTSQYIFYRIQNDHEAFP